MHEFTQLVYTIARIDNETGLANMLGTGFLISNEGVIVAPNHMIGTNSKDLVILTPRINNFNEYQDIDDTRCITKPLEVLEVDPVRDIAILKGNFTVSGQLPRLSSFDMVSVGNEVGIFGYPHCVTGRRCLTFQKAEIGAKVLLENFGMKSKYAVINTQTRPGQSGSLIYNLKTNEILGMLIGAYTPYSEGGISLGGIDPQELHQTTQCISAEYIKAMI